jgi:DNA sulfur modification protein DndE
VKIMFSAIKTTKANKERVTQLTRKLNLGAENVIARIAFAYSLSKDRKLDLSEIGDSQGKEYTTRILFGDNADIYVAMVCVNYNIYKTSKDVAKYVKMHIDDGLLLIESEVLRNNNMSGTDFLTSKIDKGLKSF